MILVGRRPVQAIRLILVCIGFIVLQQFLQYGIMNALDNLDRTHSTHELPQLEPVKRGVGTSSIYSTKATSNAPLRSGVAINSRRSEADQNVHHYYNDEADGWPSNQPRSRRFRIHVFGWGRAKSLQRLVTSLQAADYAGYTVDLAFFVDHGWDEAVAALIDTVSWPHGTTSRTYRMEHYGLQRNIMTSWNPQAGDDTLCFFFEDDVEVSPNYFKWALRALSAGMAPEKESLLVGLALNTPRVNQYTRRVHHVKSAWPQRCREGGSNTTRPPPDSNIAVNYPEWTLWGGLVSHESIDASEFLLQQPTSWGALYFPNHWRAFVDYWVDRSTVDGVEELIFAVPNAMSNDWSRSWKRYLTEFMFFNGLVMLYPNYPGQHALATTHRETGVHTTDGAIDMKELRTKKHWLFTTPLLSAGNGKLRSTTTAKLPLLDIHMMRSSADALRQRARASLLAMEAALQHQVADDNELPHTARVRRAVASLHSHAAKHTLLHTSSQNLAETGRSRDVAVTPELTVFTTMHKQNYIADATIKALEVAWPRVSVLVFGPAKMCNGVRRKYYVAACIDDSLCNKGGAAGRPTMGCLFRMAESYPYAAKTMVFSNGDILHDPKALLEVVASTTAAVSTPSFALAGRRVDAVATGTRDISVWRSLSPKDAVKQSVATLHGAWGIDYFVYQRALRPELLPFVVGGARWDNWFLNSLSDNPKVTSVDVSEAYLVYHVSEDASGASRGNLVTDGAFAAGAHNRKLSQYFWRCGSLDQTNGFLDENGLFHERPIRVRAKCDDSASLWKFLWLAEDALGYNRYVWEHPSVIFPFLWLLNTYPRLGSYDSVDPKAFKAVSAYLSSKPALCEIAAHGANHPFVFEREAVFGSTQFTSFEGLKEHLVQSSPAECSWVCEVQALDVLTGSSIGELCGRAEEGCLQILSVVRLETSVKELFMSAWVAKYFENAHSMILLELLPNSYFVPKQIGEVGLFCVNIGRFGFRRFENFPSNDATVNPEAHSITATTSSLAFALEMDADHQDTKAIRLLCFKQVNWPCST